MMQRNSERIGGGPAYGDNRRYGGQQQRSNYGGRNYGGYQKGGYQNRGGGGYQRHTGRNNQRHTGDPNMDLAYESMYGGDQQSYGGSGGGAPHYQVGIAGIPEEVINFLRYFRKCIEEQSVPEILNLYEFGFPSLTDKYFREKNWPDEDKVKQALGIPLDKDSNSQQDIFIILYNELYYRYLYAKIQRNLNLDNRFYSYQNYQDLFAYLLEPDEPRTLSLPSQWLWDIIDEFVYQFQSFCQYKANPSKRSAEDMDELINLDAWNLYPVLNILYTLTKRAQVVEQLEAVQMGRLDDIDVDAFGEHPLYFQLGYFSLIGLLRLHTMISDFYQALDSVKFLEFDPTALHNSVPNCFVTFHYFVGFCRMMRREYQDAIRIFASCLLYIQRTKHLQHQQPKGPFQYDIIAKTHDQIQHLLAICLSLHPQRIDENIQSQLVEKIGDKFARMQRGFLKLYTSLPLEKLGSFLGLAPDQELELVSQLLCFKHKLRSSTLNKDSLEEDLVTDMDFYVKDKMIYIADTKVARRCADYFIKNIHKLQESSEARNFWNAVLKGKCYTTYAWTASFTTK